MSTHAGSRSVTRKYCPCRPSKLGGKMWGSRRIWQFVTAETLHSLIKRDDVSVWHKALLTKHAIIQRAAQLQLRAAALIDLSSHILLQVSGATWCLHALTHCHLIIGCQHQSLLVAIHYEHREMRKKHPVLLSVWMAMQENGTKKDGMITGALPI